MIDVDFLFHYWRVYLVNLMKTPAVKNYRRKPLIIRGLNASGKIIEAYIPAGVLPKTDPGLAIAESLKKFPDIKPTPIREDK